MNWGQNTMRHLKLFVFPALLVIIAFARWQDADEIQDRANKVGEQPHPVSCQQLVDGQTPDNQHVLVEDWAGGEKYRVYSHSDSWSYVLIPLFPKDAAEQRDEDIRVVAQFYDIENHEDMAKALEQASLQGCLRDHEYGRQHFTSLLIEHYPDIPADKYVVLTINGELPTVQAASKVRLKALAILGVGVLWLCFSCYRTRVAYRRDKSEQWFEGQVPASQRPGKAVAAPSEAWLVCKKGFVYAVMSAPFVGYGLYLLTESKVIPASIGYGLMSASVCLMIAGGILLTLMMRRYRAQTYEVVGRDELSKAARKYFDSHADKLADLGFIRIADLSVVDTVRVPVELWLHEQGEIMVTIEYTLIMQVINFYSVSDDGQVLHTVTTDLHRSKTKLPAQCVFVNSKDITKLWNEHLKLLSKNESAGVRAVNIDPEYVTGVMDLQHRIGGWALLESGIGKSQLPPLPHCNEIIVSSEGTSCFRWRDQDNKITVSDEVRELLAAAQSSELRDSPATPPAGDGAADRASMFRSSTSVAT